MGDLYYLCFQGVWFMSTTPNGPWQTAQSVPQVIYTIPPSSPVYNVTYVTQVPASNGYVKSSYTAGYLGAFVAGAAVGAIIADGTGYYYPPYVGFYGAYPAYYPYATTYGYHAYTNPYTGAYGYGASAYGPYGGQAHWGAAYNPNTGTYARGATASTPYGSQSVAQAYNPYTGAYGQTHQGSNAYGSWGSSTVTKNGKTAYSQHESGAYGSEGTVQTTAGGKAAATSTAYGNTAAGKTSSGDMYADHNGNVYKNTGSGWQSYNNGSWNNVNKPTTSSAQSYSQEHPTSNSAQSYSQEHPSGTSSASSYDKSGAGSSSGWGEAQKDAQSRASGEASASAIRRPSTPAGEATRLHVAEAGGGAEIVGWWGGGAAAGDAVLGAAVSGARLPRPFSQVGGAGILFRVQLSLFERETSARLGGAEFDRSRSLSRRLGEMSETAGSKIRTFLLGNTGSTQAFGLPTPSSCLRLRLCRACSTELPDRPRKAPGKSLSRPTAKRPAVGRG